MSSGIGNTLGSLLGQGFDDHVEVADVDGSCRMRLSSAERARAFLEYGRTSAHLFWVDR